MDRELRHVNVTGHTIFAPDLRPTRTRSGRRVVTSSHNVVAAVNQHDNPSEFSARLRRQKSIADRSTEAWSRINPETEQAASLAISSGSSTTIQVFDPDEQSFIGPSSATKATVTQDADTDADCFADMTGQGNDDAETIQNKIINEEYKIWKKNSVFLYDVMYR